MDGHVAARLCSELRGLEAIDLTRCLRITDKTMDAIAGRPGAVGGVGDGAGGGGRKATAGWGQIEEVVLDHCKDYSEEGFMALASHAGSLKRLSLVGCRQLSGSSFAGLPAPVIRRRRVVVVSSRTLRREGIMLDGDEGPIRAKGDGIIPTSGTDEASLSAAPERPVVVALAKHDPAQAREQDATPNANAGTYELPNMLVARLMRSTGLYTEFPERVRDAHSQALLLANRLGFDMEVREAAEAADLAI